MRNLKKFLALVLAMMMTLSLMVTANAKDITADFTDADSVTEEFTTAVDVLNGMKVFKGYENGTFDPKGDITRAEMAAIIYRLHTGDATDKRANAYVGYDSFTDVEKDKWYAGYVGYCSNAGLIAGYGNGRFGPSDKLTGYQALVMLLRAMGYDQPNEFGKSDWRTHAASIATQRGMLDNVNKTNYKGTLSDNATRELVAELTFQAADLARVKYTPAYGYQTGDHTNQDNYVAYQSLGYLNYGLTEVEGIIVGNQDTGESMTRINKAVSGKPGHYAYFHQTVNWDEDTTADAGDAANVEYTETYQIDAKTGIDMFGHKVDAYYDARPGYGGTTYALYDNVKKTAVVALANDDADAKLSADGDNWTAKDDAPLGEAAQAAGFKVDLNHDKAVFNESFGISGGFADKANTANSVTDYAKKGSSAKAGSGGADGCLSLSKGVNDANGTNDGTAVPLYLLISNNSDLTVDMVVALNVETSVVSQVNAHASYPTVTVPKAGAAGAATTWNANTNSLILQGALTATSDKELGTPIVGNAIIGTNVRDIEAVVTTGATTDVTGYVAPAGVPTNAKPTGATANYWYRLSEPTQTVEGVVTQYKYDYATHTGKIVIDGKTIERSPLADVIAPKSGLTAEAQLYGNYRAYLDSDGKYIYVEPIFENKFIYGTYIDYATPLGSSAYEYTIVGVDLDGKQVVQKVSTYNGDVIGSNTNIPGVCTMAETGLPYRDAGTAVSGVTPADYKGFIVTADGALTDTTGQSTTNSPEVLNELSTKVFVGKGTGAPVAAGGSLTISSTDAKLGVKKTDATANDVGAMSLYFTGDTKFIVVDGAGTDTQKIEIYNGLTELLAGGSQVSIDGQALGANKDMYLAGTTTNSMMMYYTKSPFVYASVDGTNPEKVDTIFIPKDAITWTGRSNLFFVGNPEQDSEIAVGTNTFHLYTMYENGEKVQKWLLNGAGLTGANNYELAEDSFYELTETIYKTPTGETVYYAHDGTGTAKATGVTQGLTTGLGDVSANFRPDLNGGEKPIMDNTNYYNATSYASQTATIGTGVKTGLGSVGTNCAIFNVANAKVVNLNAPSGKPTAGCIWPGVTDLTSLNDAASTATAYATNRPKVAVQVDPNDNLTVTVIYVCWNQN